MSTKYFKLFCVIYLYNSNFIALFKYHIMQQVIKITTLLLLLLNIPYNILAQITSSAAISSQAPYATTTNFFYTIINGATITGSSTIANPIKCWWKKYDPSTNSFSINIVEENSFTSTIGALEHNGGYEFGCTDGSVTETYYCWTFEPTIVLNSAKVDTTSTKTNCNRISLIADVTTKNCTYRDPLNLSTPKTIDYQLDYNWSALPEDVEIPKTANPDFIQPIENTTYSLRITNGVGLGDINYTFPEEYKAKGIRAALIIKSLSTYTSDDNKLDTLASKGASGPYTVRFINDSKGKFDYAEINIYKDESITTYRNPIPDDPTRPFTFTEPGKYRINLVASNYSTQCLNTSADSIITIGGSVLGIPNTFTPNEDGANDEFKIAYTSLKSYNIYIYNRWGRLLYSSDDPSKGWDGGGMPVGVYFYVIEAVGIDGISYNKQGPIHLLK